VDLPKFRCPLLSVSYCYFAGSIAGARALVGSGPSGFLVTRFAKRMQTQRPVSPPSRLSDSTVSLASFWKRFQNGRKLDAPLPLLALDAEATIVDLSPAARSLLGPATRDPVGTSFFAYVHGRNLPLVMRDLAHMVCHRKQQASWLLRMRTRSGRWRWFRASVRPLLDFSSPRLLVLLRPV